jgi:hypothetical protein
MGVPRAIPVYRMIGKPNVDSDGVDGRSHN